MEYIVRFRLKPKKAGEFRQCLLDNHAKLETAIPEGWKYLGTYFTVRGFGDHQCESRWEIANYGALDHSFTDPIHREVSEFIDESYPMTSTLLKSVADVREMSRVCGLGVPRVIFLLKHRWC